MSVNIPQGGIVQFDTLNYSVNGIDVSNNNITIQYPGKYLFDYTVRGNTDNITVPLQFGLRVNKSVQLQGSNYTSGSIINSGQVMTLNGSTIVSFPDPLHGITTDVGTIVELQNTSTTNITLQNNSSINASLRVLRIS